MKAMIILFILLMSTHGRILSSSSKTKILKQDLEISSKKTTSFVDKELELAHLVKSIRSKAAKEHLKVTQIGLGKNVKKIFGQEVGNSIQRLLSTKNIDKEIQKLQTEKEKQTKASEIQKNAKTTPEVSPKANEKSPPSKSNSNKTKNAKHQQKNRKLPISNIYPDQMGGFLLPPRRMSNLVNLNVENPISSSALPPFFINGPHYHPPMQITVNNIKNLDNRQLIDPYEIQEKNAMSQLTSLQATNNDFLASTSENLKKLEGVIGAAANSLSDFYKIT